MSLALDDRRARITARARQARPGTVALSLFTALIMLLPWLLGLAARAAWYAGAWLISAIIEGFMAGWGKPPSG